MHSPKMLTLSQRPAPRPILELTVTQQRLIMCLRQHPLFGGEPDRFRHQLSQWVEPKLQSHAARLIGELVQVLILGARRTFILAEASQQLTTSDEEALLLIFEECQNKKGNCLFEQIEWLVTSEFHQDFFKTMIKLTELFCIDLSSCDYDPVEGGKSNKQPSECVNESPLDFIYCSESVPRHVITFSTQFTRHENFLLGAVRNWLCSLIAQYNPIQSSAFYFSEYDSPELVYRLDCVMRCLLFRATHSPSINCIESNQISDDELDIITALANLQAHLIFDAQHLLAVWFDQQTIDEALDQFKALAQVLSEQSLYLRGY